MKQMYPKNGRVVLHVDMNSFYASVEIARDPSLKGKPLAIAGKVEDRRGIVVTSSYEARAKGVKTTMPVWEAKRHCPNLIVMPPKFERYRKASTEIFQVFYELTPLVEPVSIDEGYLDITDCHERGSPLEIAKIMQHRILNDLHLPCSIGVAPNKFLAKMASDMKKPLGITVLRKRDVQKILWPQNVGQMHGIGKKTEAKLNKINIKTIGDLARSNEGLLKETIGIHGVKMRERANGFDERPVDPDASSEFKSIGSSTTLPSDTTSEDKINSVLHRLSTSVSRKMDRKEAVALNIQLMIRYQNRKTITRSRKLNNTISTEKEIFQNAKYLLQKHWNGKPIRLLGVTAQDLLEKKHAYKQMDLFSYKNEAKKEDLEGAVQEIQKKYGQEAVKKMSKHQRTNK